MFYNLIVAAALLRIFLIPSSLNSSHRSYVCIWRKVKVLKN